MLELNKEYTYSQICEIVGWECKAGNSKKAQIKEIESSYEFYHPVNQKTKKEKKSYIFTKQLKELSQIEHGGAHNTKNIAPMIDYIKGKIALDGEHYSMTTWYCEKLELLDLEICEAVYYGDDIIQDYCERNNLDNEKLFTDYVTTVKSVLKNIFVKALEHMQKNGECSFMDGNIFFYQYGKRKKSVGNVFTDKLNGFLKENETEICNDLNEEYLLSEKMKGRQLLMIIYGSEEYTKYFNELKISALMDSEDALDILNEEMSMQHENYYKDVSSICDDRPVVAYYRGIKIDDLDAVDNDTDALGTQITDIIRDKVRRSLSKKHYTNSWTSEIIFPYENCVGEMEKIEKLLFPYYEECGRNNFADEVADTINSDLPIWDDSIPTDEDIYMLPFKKVV